jgi:hypothetical protein
MTLNENPRVWAERRFRILRSRRERLRRILSRYEVKDIDYRKHSYEYNLATFQIHKMRVKRIWKELDTQFAQVRFILSCFGVKV